MQKRLSTSQQVTEQKMSPASHTPHNLLPLELMDLQVNSFIRPISKHPLAHRCML